MRARQRHGVDLVGVSDQDDLRAAIDRHAIGRRNRIALLASAADTFRKLNRQRGGLVRQSERGQRDQSAALLQETTPVHLTGHWEAPKSVVADHNARLASDAKRRRPRATLCACVARSPAVISTAPFSASATTAAILSQNVVDAICVDIGEHQ